VSFGNREVLAIPAGSTVRFHFDTPTADGSVRFSIGPEDVSIAPILLRSKEGALLYRLAGATSGLIRRSEDGGLSVEFFATIAVALDHKDSDGAGATYGLLFTTESTSAPALDGTADAAIDGVRVDPSARYVQLVGAATNRTDAITEPGSAVHSVLSGTFDVLPAIK
jgi:hypothetical protein